jgi:uncharacterized membrane protein
MVIARKSSQVITHMAIGFAIAYAFTGSVALGGLAVIVEPVLNVMLLPFHERAWARQVHEAVGRRRYYLLTLEKLSQTGMHMGIAFFVMFFATGSLAFGGMAAVLEPICNVILMPLHDKLWDGKQAV